MMRRRGNKKHVVILLAPGESIRPVRLLCQNLLYCEYRRLMMVNRMVLMVLVDNLGIHWSDVPEGVTISEIKCHACGWYYKIYTPDSNAALHNARAIIEP